jgi:hypothetical protein
MEASQTGLSGPEAEALVARRLEELGRDPRLVTEDAVAALRGCAASGEALRSVLTGALFLASTEDSPQVDASHVERAAALRPAEPALVAPAPVSEDPSWTEPSPPIPSLPISAAPSATRRRTPVVAILAAAAAIAVAAPSALLALRELYAPTRQVPTLQVASAPPAATVAPMTPVVPPAPVAPIVSPGPAPAAGESAPSASVALVAPGGSSQPAPPSPKTVPEPQAAPGPPAAAAPPAAPGPELIGTGPALPDSVRQVVLLSYKRGSPDAEGRADALAAALRARGIATAVVSEGGAPAAASVSYFFADDRPLAERVGAILGGPWQLATKPLRAPGRELPQPGVIRVSVPSGG